MRFDQVSLKRLFKVVGGSTPASDNPAYWDGPVTWVTPVDLGLGQYVHDSARTLSDSGYAACGTVKVPPHSLILSTRAPIGGIAIASKELSTNQGCKALVPREGVDSRYFYYQLSIRSEELNSLGRGSTFLELSASILEEVALFAPDIAAQIAIANFLDEQTARIDALIAEKQELLGTLEEHLYSYTSSLMTRGTKIDHALKWTSTLEAGHVPAEWQVKRLKFLGKVRSGIAKGKGHGERDTVFLPYLRVANVQDGYVDLAEVLEIEVGVHEVERFLLRKGDVLMNEGGDNDKLGRGTVWQGQIDPCVHQNHVFAVRLANPDLAEWVARFTSTDAARSYFFLRSKQSTNLASINQSDVRELPVPIPPPEELQPILDELRRAEATTRDLSTHVESHIARLREYRSSLISAAVTGQIDISTYKPH